MRVLLDSQVFIWLTSEPERLPATLVDLLKDSGVTRIVSVASIWEIAIKVEKGKLDFPVGETLDQVTALQATLLDVRADHALAAASLPPIHADPFDRMLVAQARLEQLTLVTMDRLIPRYDIATLPKP